MCVLRKEKSPTTYVNDTVIELPKRFTNNSKVDR